jgi:glycosyltransferase involved in cell wall biosynthesis
VKILMFGHWSDTGFGVVTKRLSEEFVKEGQDVRVIAANHRGAPIAGPMGSRVWPARIKGDDFGGNISQEAAMGLFWREFDPYDLWVPDVVLMIADAGTLWHYLGRKRPAFDDVFGPFGTLMPTFHYCPIEGDNLNPSWRDIWKKVTPVAMSKYGAQVIGEHIGQPVDHIYHGVDTDVFFPASPLNPIRLPNGVTIRSKAEAKRGAGVDPSRLMLLRTDRLVERKRYDVLFKSLVPVFAKHPNVDLVIHTHPVQPPWNIYEEVGRIPEEFHSRIRLTGAHDTFTGLAVEEMNALYNAADIYVSPTAGEGFGLTLAESLAAGTPVVSTDYAAGPEIMGMGGLAVRPLHDSYGEVVRMHSPYGMDWAQPDPRATTDAIMRLVEKPALRNELGRLGQLHVRKFSWQDAARRFNDIFIDSLRTFQVQVPEGIGGGPADSRGSEVVPPDPDGDNDPRRPAGEPDPSGGGVPGASERKDHLSVV